MEKVNLSKIFRNHFATMKDFDSKKYSKTDILFFYIAPLVISIFLSYFVVIKHVANSATELITFFAVFGGFMLNILVLVYNFDITNFKNPDVARQVLRELSSNTTYLIALACISVIVLSFIKILSGNDLPHMSSFLSYLPIMALFISAKTIITLIIFSLLNFCLTTLMILKRFNSVDTNRKF